MITFNLAQAIDIFDLFGSEPGNIVVDYCLNGHSGPGLYAWAEKSPEEGSWLLGTSDIPSEDQARAAAVLREAVRLRDEEGGEPCDS